MKQLFKEYGLVLLLNASIVIVYLLSADTITLTDILFISVIEIFFVLGFLFKNSNTRLNVIERKNGSIVIKGVFSTLELRKQDIINFRITQNFISRVFDWSRVIINTKQGGFTLYTRHIANPADLSF